MMSYDLSEINNALKSALDAKNKSQAARGEFERKILINKIAAQQEQQMARFKSGLEVQQKKDLAPFELEQKRQEKLMPSAPTRTTKDVLFEEIRQKPQDQWEAWEKQFVDTYTGGGEQAITDEQGNIVGFRPKKSVFRPKGTDEDMGFLGGENKPVGQPAAPTGRIHVKIKGGTQTGTIEAGEFDPNLYEKI